MRPRSSAFNTAPVSLTQHDAYVEIRSDATIRSVSQDSIASWDGRVPNRPMPPVVLVAFGAAPAGSDEASISAVEHDMTAALDNTKREAEVVNAGSLVLAHYAPPTFPAGALQRRLSGWVEVQFVVKSDGLVSDVIIMGAEPVGIFEQAAVDAVKKWRYKPAQRDGHAVDQRARLRMKFALDK